MSGHSHWANIQRTKSKEDAKRGKVFSKWAKLIMSAARQGGPDPDMNLSLRYAIERARADNMPKDSITRAIKKGSGELGGAAFEEVLYEAYGPGGVALVIEALTDNRNRTAPDLRYILDRKGGSLGSSGSVMWMFQRKAQFAIKREGVDEDALLGLALDHGAEDVDTEEAEIFGISAEPPAFLDLKAALDEAGYEVLDAAVRYVPDNTVSIDSATAAKLTQLLDALEEHEDIQSVSHNADFPEEG